MCDDNHEEDYKQEQWEQDNENRETERRIRHSRISDPDHPGFSIEPEGEENA